jgi:hypothetical protein
MLSSAASPFRRARPLRLSQRRRAPVPQPQQLSWLDLPSRAPGVWNRVDDADRTLVIAALAALIAKAVVATGLEEPSHD